MKEARDLLKCERCAVFLVDLECCEAVMITSESEKYEPSIISNLPSSCSLPHFFQSHLERMVKSTNQIDYDESNKADNDSKKVKKWR